MRVDATTEPARLLDVVAVAALLGVSTRHVYRLADGGRMPRPFEARRRSPMGPRRN